MSFTGLRTSSTEELIPLMKQALGSEGYTARHFRYCLEMSLRPVFEHRGRYKARFGEVRAPKAGPLEVDVTTTVEEGPAYALGEVRLLGDGLPLAARGSSPKSSKNGLQLLDSAFGFGGKMTSATGC